MRVFVTAALIIMASAAAAHEIGTTQVRLTLHRDLTWTALITTAPQTLVNRFEAEAGEPASRDLSADAMRTKLEGFRIALARHIAVDFDGRPSPATVSIDEVQSPDDVMKPAFVALKATGAKDAHTLRWRYDLSFATYALLLATNEAEPETHWLQGDIASRAFPISGTTPRTTLGIVAQYLTLGFRHIVPEGLDHILFVLGLFLLTTKLKPLLVQVTSFTVAHSVTLGLAMYGVVSVSPRIVEPMIALSIAYVAIENIATPKLTLWRPAVVFGFGLLHGLGFAAALQELHLARSEFLPALVSFNVGIELAQLAVIAAAYFAVAFWSSGKVWYRARRRPCFDGDRGGRLVLDGSTHRHMRSLTTVTA
jgi:hypothetical protein